MVLIFWRFSFQQYLYRLGIGPSNLNVRFADESAIRGYLRKTTVVGARILCSLDDIRMEHGIELIRKALIIPS
jgi:hypothetical protein